MLKVHGGISYFNVVLAIVFVGYAALKPVHSLNMEGGIVVFLKYFFSNITQYPR